MPGIRESVDRASDGETTRKGSKRFTNFSTTTRRDAKKRERRFVSPRARYGSVLARVFFVRFSRRSSSLRISRGSPVFVTAAKEVARGSEGKKNRRFYSVKSKKKNRNEPRQKKNQSKSVGRTARSSNFSSASWSSVLGTPLGSARNTAMNPNGIPADLRIKSRTSCPGCCVR